MPAEDSADAGRSVSPSVDLQREWLTDSVGVAEWLRATVRRPLSPATADSDDGHASESEGPAAPNRVARLSNNATARTFVAIVVSVAVLTGIFVAGMPGGDASGDPPASVSSSTPIPGASAAPPPTDWRKVVSRLDGIRAQAFHTADVNLLAEVYAPEAAALHTDARRISELAAAGYRLPLISHDIRSVTEVTEDGAVKTVASADGGPPVTLAVEQAMSAFEIHDSAGGLVGRTIERPAGRSAVTLVHHAGSYRILSVTDVP